MSSWHWEETNYTAWVKTKLEGTLKAFEWENNEVKFEVQHPTINGEAMVLLRRGRPIASMSITMTCLWVAVNNDDLESASGKLVLNDLGLDCIENEFNWLASTDKEDELHRRMKNLLLSSVVNDLANSIRENVLHPFLNEETKRSALAQQRRLANQDASAALPVEKVFEDTPKPFHWQERNLTAHAIQELTKSLEAVSNENAICFLNGTGRLELFGVKVSGQASRNCRGNKRYTIFEFGVEACWRATTRNKQGGFLADAKGTLDVHNLSSEDIGDLEIAFRCDSVEHPARRHVFDAVQKEGSQGLNELLRRFVDRLVEEQ